MRQRRMKNEINVVPYIDVMLVLLVIFMVTAPGKTERPLSRSELSQAIVEAQSKNPEQPVLIVGDKSVKYEAVLSVMDELQRQQVKRVGLLVQPTGK